ncbi:hypothetical protein ADL22_06095 [Streptomyces sp. NRRL F-4489]|nr:hypothetical protein ADL22_06095 [Streptomyces sp. NRRL F-4489]
MWERHAVLAQAFCISDDEVRRTQGLLDEAEARRSRTLAAFAVTVGSDEVVADLLGLDAREVRLARRTVGKDDARAVAKNLLEESARERRAALRSHPPEQPEPPRPAPAGGGTGTGTGTAGAPGRSWPAAGTTPAPPAQPQAQAPGQYQPQPQHQAQAQHQPQSQPQAPDPAPRVPPRPAPQPPAPSAPATEPAWSPALDAVLVHSHHTGADLTALAAELGLDVTILAARAHQLSAEARTTRAAPSDRIGRHRRMTDVPPAADHGSFPPTDAPPHQAPYEPHATWASPAHPTPWAPQDSYAAWAPQDAHSAWAPQDQHAAWPTPPSPMPSAPTWDPSAVTVAQHDWDGILSQWEAATAAPHPSPGQQSP